MEALYPWLKVLHVIGAIVWVGGVTTLTLLTARMVRARDHAALMGLARHAAFVGAAVLSVASITTLLAGIGMVGISEIRVTDLWILWGLAAVFLSVGLGATAIRRANVALGELAPTAAPGDARVAALQRRLVSLNSLNILILLSAVVVMVLKPNL